MSNFFPSWFKPIDASSLAVFRIMFGGLLLFESVNYGLFLCLDCMYRSSDMLFKYNNFEWVGLWPGIGLELNFLVMGLSGFCIMIGFYYRVAMIVYTICFSYLFLLDQVLYLNHFYLVIILCSIMVFLPASRYWSVDARRNPNWASATVPAWSRIWLLVQTEIVLLYAGIVKLNLDWLNLEPMRLWMNEQSQHSHAFFQWLTQDPGIALASYGVLVLHIVGAPLLLWRKTRLPVFLIYSFFHTINAFVFDIGIFPWMTIAATLLFFDPDWPKQFYRWLNNRVRNSRFRSSTDGESVDSKTKATSSHAQINIQPFYSTQPICKLFIVFGISAWLILQATVPLRHWFLPGNVAWNEAGHRFSWRMKLRTKRGTATFYVVVNGKPAVVVDPNEHLNRKQVRKMVCIPDLIWQYAQFLETQYTQSAEDDVKVYADTQCSLNTREPASLIHRLVDLTAIDRTEPVMNWVTPLTKELPDKFLPL